MNSVDVQLKECLLHLDHYICISGFLCQFMGTFQVLPFRDFETGSNPQLTLIVIGCWGIRLQFDRFAIICKGF